jgi:hypothetical protein
LLIGVCDNPWSSGFFKKIKPKFVTLMIHCSSLGKYKSGNRGYSSGAFYIKYLLHGLRTKGNKQQRIMRTIAFILGKVPKMKKFIQMELS